MRLQALGAHLEASALILPVFAGQRIGIEDRPARRPPSLAPPGAPLPVASQDPDVAGRTRRPGFTPLAGFVGLARLRKDGACRYES